MSATGYVPGPEMLASPTEEESRRAFALALLIQDAIQSDREMFAGARLHPVGVGSALFHFVYQLAHSDPAYARDLVHSLKTQAAALVVMVEGRLQ